MDYRCAQIRADYLFWKRISVIRKRRERRLFPTEKQKILFKSVKNCYTLYIRRARSSAGRAPAWHAGGRKFDPCRVHHLSNKNLAQAGFFIGQTGTPSPQARFASEMAHRSRHKSSSGPPFGQLKAPRKRGFLLGKWGHILRRRAAVPLRLGRPPGPPF